MLLEITLRADEALADTLADALLEAGALSVAIEDADAESSLRVTAVRRAWIRAGASGLVAQSIARAAES